MQRNREGDGLGGRHTLRLADGVNCGQVTGLCETFFPTHTVGMTPPFPGLKEEEMAFSPPVPAAKGLAGIFAFN